MRSHLLAMRSHLRYLPIVAVVLLVAACGGSNGGDGAAGGGSPSAADSDGGDPSGESESGGESEGEPAGGADCSAISGEEIAAFGITTQLLAQLVGQAQVDTIRDGVISNYDPDAYAATVAELHAVLDGHGVDPFGDPKDDLDFYAEVNAIAAEMMAVEGEVPAELFERYESLTNGSTDVIMRQASINAALSEVCPDLVGG